MFISPIFLLLSIDACCFEGSRSSVQLMKTTFIEGREIGLHPSSASGSLAQLVSASAVV